MVDSSGLENRHSSLFRTIEGSNPSLSFCSFNRTVSLFYNFNRPSKTSKIRRMARLFHLAEPENKKEIQLHKNVEMSWKKRIPFYV